MKTTFRLLLISLLLLGIASFAQEQAPAVNHNTWTSGAPMPTAVWFPAATGVIKSQIYLVGGYDSSESVVADNQIYHAATNSWSTGAPMPAPTAQGASAVVKNILYVFGGSPDGKTCNISTVLAYNPKTNSWSSKSPMPTARCSAAAAVDKNIIYVIGGYSSGSGQRLNTVEAYNPATDTWTEEAPMLVGKSEPAVALSGTAIVASGGYTQSGDTGDNEGYNVATNAWASLKSDPSTRNGSCFGTIGPQLYVAGGYPGGGPGTPALTVNESFKRSKNSWKTLAPMPQASVVPGSAVYKGQLYCFGGAAATYGTILNNVQIYQP